jgi:2-phospho-L-lactate transferase/gluconeogenesis factor (CofD/UPF0052 family)
MRIVVFSGGRGCTNLVKAIISQTDLDLTIVVNAYDNGKSTGRIRSFIPGLLGPSDIRKNVSLLLECYDLLHLANFLEYRMPSNLQNLPMLEFIQLSNMDDFISLSFEQYKSIESALSFFDMYQINVGVKFDTFDCPIGNVILASLFIKYKNDFNSAVTQYQKIFLPKNILESGRARVLNVTEGENLYLIARASSGQIFLDEAEIVVNENNEIIREIALVSDFEKNSIQLAFDNVTKPNPNLVVLQSLRDMDILIYGPGTQASSLLPSYLTSRVLDEVSKNLRARKIFVSNLIPDYDDPVSNVISRLETFFQLGRLIVPETRRKDLVTNVFSELKLSEIPKDLIESNYPGIVFQTDDWLIEGNKHLGSAIVRQISISCDHKFKYKPGLISIIVYSDRFLFDAENSADMIEFLESNIELDFEIIVITRNIDLKDSIRVKEAHEEEAKIYNKIKFIGSIHESMLKSRGDVIAFINDTQLYNLSDLAIGIHLLINNERSHLFLGSRNLRIFDLRKQIRSAYPTQPLRGFISYWGSLLISISFLIRFRRFITDPLSGIKIFKKTGINRKAFEIIAKDIDVNLIKYFIKAELPIQQFDIGFNPNQLDKNNRHSIIRGLKSLVNIWRLP